MTHVPVNLLQSMEVSKLKPGQLLETVGTGGGRLLMCGRQPGETLIVDLDDMLVARHHDWQGNYGVLFRGVRFEVDPQSGKLLNDDKPKGALLLSSGRVALLCSRERPGTSFWLAVDRDEPMEQTPLPDSLVFTRWRIMWGEDKEREVKLFEFGVSGQ